MARSEARLAVTIWSDADFLALSARAQRMFMFLLSQKDLAHDGVIALRVRRWSKTAHGLTADGVLGDLAELEHARFIVVDEDAEELLVRSFIRRDKVYRQPNVLRSAADHLKGVTSAILLRGLAAELDRIVSGGDVPATSAGILAEMRAVVRKGLPNPSSGTPGDDVKGSGNPFPNPSGKGQSSNPSEPDTDRDGINVSAGVEGSGNPSGKGSGNPSVGTRGERGVSTTVTTDSPFPFPLPSEPLPRPSAGGRAGTAARKAGADPEPPSERCTEHLDDDNPPPCGRCADARRRREAWNRDQAGAAAVAASHAARERAAAVRAEINACSACDNRGRVPTGAPCAHDPVSAERTRRGAAAARAALAAEATEVS